jgi:glycosyltransferase involved in cell wall biosynthesis
VRIIELSGVYPPIIGGLEKAVEAFAGALSKRGHSVIVVTLAHGREAEVTEEGGVAIHRLAGWNTHMGRFYLDASRQFAPPCPDPGAVSGIRKLINSFRPDVIHAHDWMVYSALAARGRNGPRVVLSLHDHGLICVKRSFLKGRVVCDGPAFAKCVACSTEQYGAPKAAALTTAMRLASPLLRRVALFLPVSEAVRRIATDGSGLPPSRFRVVPAPVADQAEEVVTAARDRANPDPYLLYVGALAEHKGIEVLAQAYEALDEPPPLRLLGARHGSSALSLPTRATVLENVAHPEVLAAYRHAICTVVPSVWEDPLPTVAREAMLCGSPVVASAIGGLPEFVKHEETGLLVPPGDVPALRAALERMIGDAALRERLSAAGMLSARRYYASEVVLSLERVLEEVMA